MKAIGKQKLGYFSFEGQLGRDLNYVQETDTEDGRKIVILNPNHGRLRTNATLMEEVSHVFLGHQPSRLKVVAETENGQTISREYRAADEEAAYATGAAALVPFSALRRFVLEGQTSKEIAKHFGVSRELVEYRLKVTRLWKMYRTAHSAK